MGKKMKLPFLSQSKSLDSKKLHYSSSCTSSPPQWPFPPCGNIKTLSFRDDAFTTFNSAYIDTEMTNASTESFFTVSSSSRSFSTMCEEFGDPVESVIRGLRSDRLFIEPEQSCSLVLQEEEEEQQQQQNASSSSDIEDHMVLVDSPEKIVYKESELMSLESNNPCEDFRRSMEEMVEAHGLKDWQGLEELLGCYLKINGKNNHGYIMGAFIDLLARLSFTTTPPTTTSSSSSTSSLLSTNMNCSSSPCSPLSLPSSSLTTPCLSSLLDHDDHNDDNDDEHDDR